MINHLLLSSLARVDAGSGVLSALFVLLLLLGHVNGDGDRDATDKREATRVGPSDETWVGFDTLSSSPCLRTSKKASVTLCLFGGRVLHMDGTPNLEPWFLPASQEWRSKVTTPVGFGGGRELVGLRGPGSGAVAWWRVCFRRERVCSRAPICQCVLERRREQPMDSVKDLSCE